MATEDVTVTTAEYARCWWCGVLWTVESDATDEWEAHAQVAHPEQWAVWAAR